MRTIWLECTHQVLAGSSVNPLIDLRTEPDGLASRFAAVSHLCLSEDLTRARARG